MCLKILQPTTNRLFDADPTALSDNNNNTEHQQTYPYKDVCI